MSTTTLKLEDLVATMLANRTQGLEQPTPRQRLEADRTFSAILKLIAPRIRHFIRQYGLQDHWEDAEQVCAIAVHTGLNSYDPDKAKFTTHINWQLRGELQGLRFRLMTDQRPSAKKVAATTVSIHTPTSGSDGESATLETVIMDENALDITESGAGTYLARSATEALINAYIEHERKAGIQQLKKHAKPSKAFRRARPDLPIGFRSTIDAICPSELAALEERLERDREIIVRSIFRNDSQYQISDYTGLTRERIRQISRRAAKTMAAISESDPRFELLPAMRQHRVECSPSATDRQMAAI